MDASARDLAALQGAWEQVGFEENGVVDPPNEHGEPGALTVIEGDRFTVRTVDGRVLLHGRFELDASVTPRAITWIDAIGREQGQRLPASYVLDGDDLVFIAADADMPRPKVFCTTAGQTLRRFTRVGWASAHRR